MSVLLQTGASAAPPPNPDPQRYCASTKALATIVMGKRQEGASREWMVRTFNPPAGNVRQVMMGAIEASFLLPVEKTPAEKARATANFANALHTNCMYRFTGRPK